MKLPDTPAFLFFIRGITAALAAAALLCFPFFGARADTDLMVYMIGTDLEEDSGAASVDILEMLRSEPPEDVHLFVMAGGAGSWALRELEGGGASALRIEGENLIFLYRDETENMGDARTLTVFLEECSRISPAEENILIIWGHGNEDPPGVGYDRLHGEDVLTLQEIRKGIENSGCAIDILGFDACGMAGEEAFGALAGCCGHLLASSGEEDLAGWPYRRIISGLTGEPEEDSVRIRDAVNEYYARRGRDTVLIQLF